MKKLGLIRDAAVLIENGTIAWVGAERRMPEPGKARLSTHVDAKGGVVLPGYVDSHTHPVWLHPRLDDFEKRLQGASYEEIAKGGGGILSSVNGVRGATEEDLLAALKPRLARFLAAGTTTIEAKSGYGLDAENELKMLRVLKKAGQDTPLTIVPTFLGAHAVPPELDGRRADYVRRVAGEMTSKVSEERLAVYADVFCDQGYFTLEETRAMLTAAKAAGLKTRLHADQISRTGAARLAVEMGAASADHLDRVGSEEIASLARSETAACLLPASNFFLNTPYPPARLLLDAGAAVTLATDFNPGTAPCLSMAFVVSLACTQMKMAVSEAVTAATANAAWSLGLQKAAGTIEPGKRADLICYDAMDHREIAYYVGGPPLLWVMKNGTLVHGS
jgi:imidazolonepropionase